MNYPKTHQPSACKTEMNKSMPPRDLTFAIGEEHEPGSFGMWFGPNPSLEAMLEEPGRSEHSCIIQFNPDWTDKVVYRWDEENQQWCFVND